MKTIVGFTFTDSLIEELTQLGFKFTKNDLSQNKGYYQYFCYLTAKPELPQVIEIRKIIDEEIYFIHEKKKDFSPFIYDSDIQKESLKYFQENLQIKDILDESMPSCELRLFLKIRKIHFPWAIELSCTDFNHFKELISPELIFTWKQNPAALIHLGTSCFDLLITQA